VADESTPHAAKRPRLIYDGDCTFCAYWAHHWQHLTGERVEYLPYQQAAAQLPNIPLSEFQRAVQYLAPDGRIFSAAEASFLTLKQAPGKGLWLFLYRKLPGFAPLSELGYAFIAAHRSTCYRISLLLWGKDYRPPQHDLVSFWFLRLLGLIYLSAFVSFGVQAQGLIGAHGILPVQELVSALSARFGAQRFFAMPMLFWFDASDVAVQTVCWTGAALSLLLALNVLTRTSLCVLYVLYLSLLYAGQDFLSFQWDIFLLETGFLALLMTFARAQGIWLLRWLLFRFMFMSGVVKLASGDPNWWNLSALSYHFLTQPLPTPLAWSVAQLPPAALKVATGALFLVELVVPFCIFCPRRLRFSAAFGILLLQSCILLTGNYNWFNFQTMLLCLLLFDDAALRRILAQSLPSMLRAPRQARAGRRTALLAGALALLLVICSLVQMDARFGGNPPSMARSIDALIEPLHIVNPYGLFAVMTTQRDEIVIEGSSDGVNWQAYEFRYKPGDLTRRPRWNIPHQPRLDWQMWFAALDDPQRLPWFHRLLQKLLENEPTVTALLAKNPFASAAPAYVRAQFYEYTFAGAGRDGEWWERRYLGVYFPAVHLRSE
jgi:predicted DCC family thiol-disulfide oxidoreductase YuxK